MEKSGKIEDGVMDNLLQGFIKRQMKPGVVCEGFDADLANAYLERVMAAREQTRYESHLTECTMCRKQVIALAGLVDSEVAQVKVAAVAAGVPASPNQSTADASLVRPASEEQANWLARLKGWFGILATPRFALAATAALALAVAIPYVLVQNSKQSQSDVAQAAKEAGTAEQKPGQNIPPPSTSPNNHSNNPSPGETGQSPAGKQQPGEPKTSTPAPAAEGQPAEAAPGGAGTGTASPAKEEAVATDKEKSNEVAKTTSDTAGGTTQPEPARNQPPEPEKRDIGRIDPNDAKRVDNDKGNASTPTTIKPGNNPSGPSREVAPTVRPESPRPAPAPSARSEAPPRSVGGRRFIPPSESARERANASASRRVGKKTFWLVDDTWTDENYRSDKEMPIIPLIKDSENYKNVLEKHSDLKKFFSAFGANERAIIVRKEMAYKLIPQDGNK
jgi:hypothetical protein